jgi:hypothetical protein
MDLLLLPPDRYGRLRELWGRVMQLKCERRTNDLRCMEAEARLLGVGISAPVFCNAAACAQCQREGTPEAATVPMRLACAVAPQIAHRLDPPPPVPADVAIPPGVGREVYRLLQSRYAWPQCEQCFATARKMNRLGPAGCREIIPELIEELLRNARDLYARMTPEERADVPAAFRVLLDETPAESIAGRVGQAVAETTGRIGLRWLVKKAIAAEEARLRTFPAEPAESLDVNAPPRRLEVPAVLKGDQPPRRLAVVASIFNSRGYRSIRENWQRFRAALQPLVDSGRLATVVTAEALFGDQEQTVDADDIAIVAAPDQILWQKERLLNLAIASLPEDVDAVAWIDPDVTFLNPDWPEQTLAELGRGDVVQLFRRVLLETSLNGPVKAWASATNGERGAELLRGGKPGYAWAARRSAIGAGLYDRAVSGSADLLMLFAWRQRWGFRNDPDLDHGPAVEASLRHWVRGQRVRRLGSVPGTLVHHWHGSRDNRQYTLRHRAVREAGFDPARDLELADNGLWRWRDPESPLARAMAEYFTTRNDDQGRM